MGAKGHIYENRRLYNRYTTGVRLMKLLYKTALFIIISAMIDSCGHENVDDRAAREAKEYTEKNCPTPPLNFTRTDSMTFDRGTRTLTYFMSLVDKADNADAINSNRAKLRKELLNGIINATNLKVYKDGGLSFRYVFRSGSTPSKTLFDVKFTKKEYGD